MIRVLIISLLFCGPVFSQLSEDKNFNKKLLELLSRNVDEVFVKDVCADTSVLFLDAREKNEFAVSHLKNAIWVGYETFSMKSIKNIPKDKKIVVYCTVGYRSEQITKKISKAGYANVSNLIGGIVEWKNLGNSVVDSADKPTEKVHTYDQSWSVWLKKGIKVY